MFKNQVQDKNRDLKLQYLINNKNAQQVPANFHISTSSSSSTQRSHKSHKLNTSKRSSSNNFIKAVKRDDLKQDAQKKANSRDQVQSKNIKSQSRDASLKNHSSSNTLKHKQQSSNSLSSQNIDGKYLQWTFQEQRKNVQDSNSESKLDQESYFMKLNAINKTLNNSFEAQKLLSSCQIQELNKTNQLNSSSSKTIVINNLATKCDLNLRSDISLKQIDQEQEALQTFSEKSNSIYNAVSLDNIEQIISLPQQQTGQNLSIKKPFENQVQGLFSINSPIKLKFDSVQNQNQIIQTFNLNSLNPSLINLAQTNQAQIGLDRGEFFKNVKKDKPSHENIREENKLSQIIKFPHYQERKGQHRNQKDALLQNKDNQKLEFQTQNFNETQKSDSVSKFIQKEKQKLNHSQNISSFSEKKNDINLNLKDSKLESNYKSQSKLQSLSKDNQTHAQEKAKQSFQNLYRNNQSKQDLTIENKDSATQLQRNQDKSLNQQDHLQMLNLNNSSFNANINQGRKIKNNQKEQASMQFSKSLKNTPKQARNQKINLNYSPRCQKDQYSSRTLDLNSQILFTKVLRSAHNEASYKQHIQDRTLLRDLGENDQTRHQSFNNSLEQHGLCSIQSGLQKLQDSHQNFDNMQKSNMNNFSGAQNQRSMLEQKQVSQINSQKKIESIQQQQEDSHQNKSASTFFTKGKQQICHNLQDFNTDMKATFIDQDTQKQYEFQIFKLKEKLATQEKLFQKKIQDITQFYDMKYLESEQKIEELQAKVTSLEEMVKNVCSQENQNKNESLKNQMRGYNPDFDFFMSARSNLSPKQFQMDLSKISGRQDRQGASQSMNKQMVTESNFADDYKDLSNFQVQELTSQRLNNDHDPWLRNQPDSRTSQSNQSSAQQQILQNDIKNRISNNNILGDQINEDLDQNAHRPQSFYQSTYRSENIVDTYRAVPKNNTANSMWVYKSNLQSPDGLILNQSLMNDGNYISEKDQQQQNNILDPKINFHNGQIYPYQDLNNDEQTQRRSIIQADHSRKKSIQFQKYINKTLLIDQSSKHHDLVEDQNFQQERSFYLNDDLNSDLKRHSESDFEIEVPNEELNHQIRKAIDTQNHNTKYATANPQTKTYQDTKRKLAQDSSRANLADSDDEDVNVGLVNTESRVQSSLSFAQGTNKPKNSEYIGIRSPGASGLESLNQSGISNQHRGQANLVYKTGNFGIQNLIAERNLRIDSNLNETGGYSIKDLLSLKGTKCQCKQGFFRNTGDFRKPNQSESLDEYNNSESNISMQTQHPCGDLCKHLTSDQQRQIIHAIMFKETGSLINRANSGNQGDKKYLISSAWWQQWCDFVNYDQKQPSFRQSSFRNNESNQNQTKFQVHNTSSNPQQIQENEGINQVKIQSSASKKQSLSKEAHQPCINADINEVENMLQLPSESTRIKQQQFREELLILKNNSRERSQSKHKQPSCYDNEFYSQGQTAVGTALGSKIQSTVQHIQNGQINFTLGRVNDKLVKRNDSSPIVAWESRPSIVPGQITQNTDQNLFLDFSNICSYQRPGIIRNQGLLKDGRSMNLKDSIIEHHDFEAVTANVWRHLYSWYSADWCIMRYLKRDKLNRYALYLDLYPELNNYLLTNNDNYDDMDVDQDDDIAAVKSIEKMILQVPDHSNINNNIQKQQNQNQSNL